MVYKSKFPVAATTSIVLMVAVVIAIALALTKLQTGARQDTRGSGDAALRSLPAARLPTTRRRPAYNNRRRHIAAPQAGQPAPDFVCPMRRRRKSSSSRRSRCRSRPCAARTSFSHFIRLTGRRLHEGIGTLRDTFAEPPNSTRPCSASAATTSSRITRGEVHNYSFRFSRPRPQIARSTRASTRRRLQQRTAISSTKRRHPLHQSRSKRATRRTTPPCAPNCKS